MLFRVGFIPPAVLPGEIILAVGGRMTERRALGLLLVLAVALGVLFVLDVALGVLSVFAADLGLRICLLQLAIGSFLLALGFEFRT